MQQEYYSQAGMEQAIQELITKTINNAVSYTHLTLPTNSLV